MRRSAGKVGASSSSRRRRNRCWPSWQRFRPWARIFRRPKTGRRRQPPPHPPQAPSPTPPRNGGRDRGGEGEGRVGGTGGACATRTLLMVWVGGRVAVLRG